MEFIEKYAPGIQAEGPQIPKGEWVFKSVSLSTLCICLKESERRGGYRAADGRLSFLGQKYFLKVINND